MNFFQCLILQGDLDRVKMENRRLTLMLDQLKADYTALQMHMANLMQEKKAEEQEVFDGKFEEKKKVENSGVLMPRQFMDLGLAANAEVDDPASPSIGRSRDQLGSPTNVEVASMEEGIIKNENVGVEEKKEIERHNFSPPKNVNVDQVEATMRKARVSVRARSDAPIVSILYMCQSLHFFNFAIFL